MTDVDLPVLVAAGVLVRRGSSILLQQRGGRRHLGAARRWPADDVLGDLVADGDETLAIEWFDVGHLPDAINDYNRELLARAGVRAR